MNFPSKSPGLLRRSLWITFLCLPLLAFKMDNDHSHIENLPPFNPHRADFTCQIEAHKVPRFDAQADAWFAEAQALEDPSIYVDDRDYNRIIELTRKAAERHHWKAMLNLASLYVEKRDSQHGEQDALSLVEAAVRLGIPAAYDRMGTYYMNATGVKQDATRAYAYFQRAAEMGSPQAMTFLGSKISATWNNPAEGFWANYPVAKKMLECALGQGYGPAAYELHFLYAKTRTPDGKVIGDGTADEKARAVRMLQKGVALGCERCARALAVAFRTPESKADALVSATDEARSKRYSELSRALSFNPNRRFPNLDKVLPLPPAKLPAWNGKRESLVRDAMGVTPPPPAPPPGAAALRSGRYFLAAEFALRLAGIQTIEPRAPAPAYWQPTAPGQDAATQTMLATIPPGLYLSDEPFERFYQPNGGGRLVSDVVWERWDTIHHNHYSLAPRAAEGLTRTVTPASVLASAGLQACPATGTWQPWVQPDHPLSSIVNQPWRQAWLIAGQPFPQPNESWLLDLPAADITWHLMVDAAEANEHPDNAHS